MFLTLLTVLLTDVDHWEWLSVALLLRFGGWWSMNREMNDGRVEVPAVHEPIVWTRFAKKNVLRLRGTKRVRVELQRPVPHSLRPLSFNRLPHDSRSCLAPLIDPLTQVAVPLRRSPHRCWLKECMMIH